MNSSKMSVVFVVDIRNWAFDSVAKNLKKKLSDNFKIDIIYWEDFSSPSNFLAKINDVDPSCVHFFFREQLSIILSSMDVSSKLLQRFCKRAITTHVPDYLYSDDVSLINKRTLFNFVDSYFTTNSDLEGLYKASLFVPAPWGVIYDWIELESTAKSDSSSDDKVRIIWSGNSLWGEYAGHVDYKGLKTVIIPALTALKQENYDFEFVCLDSSNGKISNNEVLQEMQRADVLIIASEKEGTPLTLIEAMANSCAIVSTDVGIASEVLPQEQIDFLYTRSSDELYAKLKKLISNPNHIRELGIKNNDAWKKNFGGSSKLHDKWSNFLYSAVKRYKEEGASRKIDLLPGNVSFIRSQTVSTVRWAGRVVSKLGMVDALNRISPKFGATYHTLVHGSHINHNVDYSIIEGLYCSKISSMKEADPIVVGAPMWKGVAASTQTVFPEYYIQYPFTDGEYPEVTSHVYLDRMSELLAQSPAKVIIYSGGSLIHKELARLVKKQSINKRQYFMWHGSPAQWVDNGQLSFFDGWRQEYDNNNIDGIICLKPDLDYTLNRMGINAFCLTNPVPVIDDTRLPVGLSKTNIKIGLFSSISSWYKNPFPQLVSVAGFNSVELTTNLAKSDVALALPNAERVKYVHHMSRQDFISVLKRQDINLYVTNTECSPMIALESWACLVPCIVGPAGDVYSVISEELGAYLVEKNVDNPAAIARRIEKVIENYDEIVRLMQVNRSVQRAKFIEMRNMLLEKL